MYLDRFNFTHDKKTDGEMASSNNPLIYSALFRSFGGTKYDFKGPFFKYMFKSLVLGNDISITRHPDNSSPTSLDEIIGALYLELIDYNFLIKYGWRWHDTLYSPKWYNVLGAALYCLNKPRNFFKDNKVRDLHPIAYNTPPHIRYYALKKGNKCALLYSIPYYLWLLSVFLKSNKNHGDVSQKNIAYLIMSDLNSFLTRFVNFKKHIDDYFEPDHIIRKLVI